MIGLRNSIYFQINAETWQFFKQALPVQGNDRYWASILAEGEKITKKYKDTPQAIFAKDQVFSVVNELDRIRKAGSLESFRKPDQAARKPLQRPRT